MFKSLCLGFLAMMMLTVSVKEADGLAAPPILYSLNLENTLPYPITVDVTYDRFIGDSLIDTFTIPAGGEHFFGVHSFTQEITEYYYYIKSVKISCPTVNDEIVVDAPFAKITSPTKDLKATVKMSSNKISVDL